MLIIHCFLIVDYVDDSGIRLTVTPTLRLHDAGILFVAARVDPSLAVPPNQSDFVTTAFCNESILHMVYYCCVYYVVRGVGTICNMA